MGDREEKKKLQGGSGKVTSRISRAQSETERVGWMQLLAHT